MSLLKFSLSALLLVILVWVAQTHNPLGSPLPALGSLLSPFEGFWQNAEAYHTTDRQSISLSNPLGYRATAQIDARGVPHIFAPSLVDAAYLQGYLEARDRLWQMDISVRAVGGELAEILGPDLLERDRQQRRMGFRVAARRALATFEANSETKAVLDAYTAGVNAYVNQLHPADYPVEFKLLGYTPQPWSPYKTALFFKNMAQVLCMRADDIAASKMRQLFGPDWFAHYYPERNPRQAPIISAGTEWPFTSVLPTKTDTVGLLPSPEADFPPAAPDGIGSNNWAISGSRTQSGKPLLANDMHLNLTLPAIWYELQIHTPQTNTYGVSFPGVPLITIGFNEDIAWGATNVGHDVLDWYEVDWQDADKRRYRLEDSTAAVKMEVDTIRVRGAVADTLRTPWTVWGPVVYDSLPGEPDKSLAMYWLAHEDPRLPPVNIFRAFIGLMRARNYEEYRTALTHFSSPALNFAFAARDGDIAMTVAGTFPLRQPQRGGFVQAGQTAAQLWPAYIPTDQVPFERNPARGFVGSANQRSVDANYPYYFLGRFDDYRGRYLHQALGQVENATYEDMQQLQLDNYSLLPADVLPTLLTMLDSNQLTDTAARAYELLVDWDYRFEANEKAPALFSRWWSTFSRATTDEIQAIEGTRLYPEIWRLVELVRDAPTDTLFDIQETPERETAVELARRSFQDMLANLPQGYLENEATYGSQRPKLIQHLANLPGFSSDTLYLGGYRQALNAIDGSLHGPSWRVVVALEEEVRAWGVYPGGQSGNPGSPLYETGVAPWAEGRYFELFFMRDSSDQRQSILQTVQLQ